MMKNLFIIFCLLLGSACSIAQRAQENCSRAIISNRLKSKLDSSICVPQGYHITDILDVDLNGDLLKDKIIRWQKIKIVDGDTVFYSLYNHHKNATYSFDRTFSNLKPLIFKNYSDEYKTGKKVLDSIKLRYVNPQLFEIEFEENKIEIALYTESVTLKKLHFTYSKKDNTWILTREQQWLRYKEAKENLEFDVTDKLEYDGSPTEQMRIEDFDILKYLGW
jgi:hypothetical protein